MIAGVWVCGCPTRGTIATVQLCRTITKTVSKMPLKNVDQVLTRQKLHGLPPVVAQYPLQQACLQLHPWMATNGNRLLAGEVQQATSRTAFQIGWTA